MKKRADMFQKLAWSLPWLVRYPFWRAGELLTRGFDSESQTHLIFIVANHFEPAWSRNGGQMDLRTQMLRLDDWCKKAQALGDAVRDSDGTPFRHTNFYPGEQYHKPLLDRLAALQADGFGEVEIHLHHGVDRPDTPENLRRVLTEFRDVLAEDHKCLSTVNGSGPPKYAFVHGNWALANSSGGRFCGVDSEMQILAETGCYADFTLPAAPNQAQVPRVNAIYQCGHSLEQRSPHRSGPRVRVGSSPALPIIFTGPLVFNWKRRIHGVPVPRLDDGVLTANYAPDLARLERWRRARIGVKGMGAWVFIKLTCHGFVPEDQAAMIGDPMRRFLEETIALGDRTGHFKVHFATAREAFNMVLAASEQLRGEPGNYRNYRLRQIMEADKIVAPIHHHPTLDQNA
jgi:hypothetical protein